MAFRTLVTNVLVEGSGLFLGGSNSEPVKIPVKRQAVHSSFPSQTQHSPLYFWGPPLYWKSLYNTSPPSIAIGALLSIYNT